MAHTLNDNLTLPAVLFILSFAIAMIAYYTVLEGVKGLTLGKWLLQIAREREDLTALGLRRSATRNSIRFDDALPFVVSYALGSIVARSNAKPQR